MRVPAVLLVVDVQKGFVTPASAHVVAPIETLQVRFERVVFTAFENADPSPFRDILAYDKLSPNDPDTELALRPRDDAYIHNRCAYGGGRSLIDRLRGMEAETVYLCGIATEACVLKTALDLFEAGIRPLLLADLCASDKHRRYHDMALEILSKAIGPHNLRHSGSVLAA
ncbi:isochorismatase hydrolase [Asticcacaulis excentricus CB 48]|uniref:Isochorismatase hydrolase n=1 Tax=Asticcacaulis excentricus (strain ATCC 15261 / DSM 4724 / KCTC 12464 / NCIMB 9791 / VKM B-1370 / CB 48) TaxID=573065 RepID=E8RM14_ASTEC|nr:isochorismatase hydrolase [Asticcacaulis excentricus CB 48]